MINRVILLVMDSVGIGALPDADKFGDTGANTLGNIAISQGGINLPNLQNLGLGNIDNIVGIKPVRSPVGAFGRAIEFSNGKDTTTGHWELAGLHLTEPFKTFPNGFPESIINTLENKTGRKFLGNKPISGTVIIEELGIKHMKTGSPIIYTSADSVLQIAAHEDIIPLKELYTICKIARGIMVENNAVARIIARPFIGKPGNFIRTHNRKDYSLDPPRKTVLDIAKKEGLDVIAIGKIEDIFNGRGITYSERTKNNMDGIDKTIECLNKQNKGIIFTNLVDFDSCYGHRRDPKGYKKALEEMDKRIPEILDTMRCDDIIIFTADHGNDPTHRGTDHTREYVPIIIYGNKVKGNVNIGTRQSFADVAATVSDILGIPSTGKGRSFKKLII